MKETTDHMVGSTHSLCIMFLFYTPTYLVLYCVCMLCLFLLISYVFICWV